MSSTRMVVTAVVALQKISAQRGSRIVVTTRRSSRLPTDAQPASGYADQMRILLLMVAVVGCDGEKKGPSAEELHKQLAPIVEPKLVVIEKILAAPFPAPTGTLEKPSAPIEMVRDSGENQVKGNALYAFEADLRTLDRYQRNPLRYNFNGELVNDCFQIVRKRGFSGGHFDTHSREPRPWKGDEHIVGMKLPKCAALRYLLVVKLEAFKDTDYIDKETFGAGGALAQVHIFDLGADGKHLGGVAFAAESSDYVRGTDTTSDLRENFYRALHEAVRAHVPDARL